MISKDQILAKVNKEDIYRYLNAKQEIDVTWKTFIDEIILEVMDLIAPVYTSVMSRLECDKDRIKLIDYGFEFTSRQFSKHIEGSKNLLIVAATIGHGIERKIKYYFTSNPTRAIIIDACGSAIIEAYCDCIEEVLLSEAAKDFKGFTPRFSPGYGDLTLGVQRKMFEQFEFSKKTGIHLSQGDLMIPQKSVVFLIGNETGQRDDVLKCTHKCGLCTLKNCIYRQEASTNA